MNKPTKLNDFMYALMKKASMYSLNDFLEYQDISPEEYEEIEQHFWKEYGIRL
ncbi:hypothetical protein [Paenibacillus sp. FSL E2-0178]|uniref:hypothetical protein n=1 Tax=Paenibacillus sp. FSL E2-0178 TaxID=2921361 RepID=UPI0031590A0D